MREIRVCVADGDADAASVLCDGLRLHGYEAFPVHTGGDALEASLGRSVDLLLLDATFPDIDGFEICKRLKDSPQTRDVAVVFVSAMDSQEDVLKGFRAGAADYIGKPYNLPMVMVRLETALRARMTVDRSHTDTDSLWGRGYTDQLTGLRNRRYLLERLEEEVEEAYRYDYPLSCVVFDVAEVSALDLELGPVSMDDLLIELAMSLRSYSRRFDVLARYDGTVFAAILPHAPLDQAVQYASKILDEVDATTFSDPSLPTEVQLRAGIVTCRNGVLHDADHVLGEVMQNLLQAKSTPSDRLVARDLAET